MTQAQQPATQLGPAAAPAPREGPSDLRLMMASLAAAGASTCLILPIAPVVALYACVVAWFHALLLGLPLYRWRYRGRVPPLGASLGWSFVIGAGPFTLLFAFVALEPGSGFNAWSGNVQTVENGRTTLAGWLELLLSALLPGLLGMLGGAAFHAVLRGSARPGAPRQGAAAPPPKSAI